MNKGNGAQKRYSERERRSWRGKKLTKPHCYWQYPRLEFFRCFTHFLLCFIIRSEYAKRFLQAALQCIMLGFLYFSLQQRVYVVVSFRILFDFFQPTNTSSKSKLLKVPNFWAPDVRMQLISKLKMSTTKKESNTYNINKIIFTSQFLFLVTSDGMNKNFIIKINEVRAIVSFSVVFSCLLGRFFSVVYKWTVSSVHKFFSIWLPRIQSTCLRRKYTKYCKPTEKCRTIFKPSSESQT